MMKSLYIMFGVFLLTGLLWGADTTTQNKNITILTGAAGTDAKSDVKERLLEECILSLPKPADLIPVVSSDAGFLKGINGDPTKNDFVKSYSAVIEVNYLLYQKVMFIVSSGSVMSKEPVMKEMEKTLRQTQRFESSPVNGDIFAGRSDRAYYFSTPELAVADARKKAEAWLLQQAPVVCVRGKSK